MCNHALMQLRVPCRKAITNLRSLRSVVLLLTGTRACTRRAPTHETDSNETVGLHVQHPFGLTRPIRFAMLES